MGSCLPSVTRVAGGLAREEERASSASLRRSSFSSHSCTWRLLRGLLCVGAWMWLVLHPSGAVQAQSLQDLQNPPKTQSLASDSARATTDNLFGQRWQGALSRPGEPCEPTQTAPTRSPSQKAESEKPSRVEQLISGKIIGGEPNASDDLRQFGYAVFQKAISTFAPVTNVPVGPDYIIGPGDSFTVTLWGRTDARYTVVVDRNGQIVLPEVGALKVWGMKFDAMESYLHSEMSRKFTDFKMSVTMDRLRTIQVFVVGEAATPGTYTVSSLSTVINALFAAGGPSKNGSLRKIRLLRTGADSNGIDLYTFLLGGDRRSDARLQDGDTILIPLIGPVVAVAGNVKRPAIYEMVRPIPDLEFDQTASIDGQVRFPGTYPISRDETLRWFIERAGGYIGMSYLKGPVFTRESAKEVQRRRLDQLANQVEESMLTGAEQKISGGVSPETVSIHLLDNSPSPVEERSGSKAPVTVDKAALSVAAKAVAV